ncbi:hypothetical protein [Paenirhodobacter sp.]|uniref:hypothetical protein n=1 Tax=Paenirhodobacter sp. TaxID=1965326 RepID=UPI003B41B396
MRPSVKRVALWLALGLPGAALAQQPGDVFAEEDVTPGIDVGLGFLPVDGDVPFGIPPSDRALRVRVDLTDAVTGRPASDRRLTAWLRPADPANPTCQAAVAAFRSTRSLPFGAVDLNGILVVSRNSDETVHVADPRLGNRRANLTAAHSLPERPSAIAADSYGMRILVTLPERGELLALSPFSAGRSVLLSGRPGIGGAEPLADGRFWAASPGEVGLHAADGAVIARIAVDGMPRLLSVHRPDPRGYGPPQLGRFGVVTDRGEVLVIDPETGALTARLREAAPRDAALLDGASVAILAAGGRAVHLRYGDDPDRAERLDLPAPASRLDAHPEGRYAVAWHPGSASMTLIDSATMTVHPIRPPRAGTVTGLITTTEGALALSLDGGLVQVIDLDRVRTGRAYDAPTVDLGGAAEPDPDLTGPLLVSLSPSSSALALDPARQLAWLIEDGLTTETPAMDAIRLRTGVPQGLYLLDRSFRRTAAGIYETTAMLPPGPQELVLAGTDPPFARCIPFRAEGEPEHLPVIPLQAALTASQMQAGRPGRVVLHLLDPEGRDHTPRRMTLLLTSLTGPARQMTETTPAPEGGAQLDVTFPVPGSYAVQPLRLPSGYRLNATPVIEVEP